MRRCPWKGTISAQRHSHGRYPEMHPSEVFLGFLFHRRPLSNEGCMMTEPTDPDNLPAVPSCRRFLREGGALMGGAVLAGGPAGRDGSARTEYDNPPPNGPEALEDPLCPTSRHTYQT